MRESTKTALSAILAADESISKETANRAIAILEGDETPRQLGRVIRTTEAARILGVTTKTLRNWTKGGALVPVYAGGNKLRTGYTDVFSRAGREEESKR